MCPNHVAGKTAKNVRRNKHGDKPGHYPAPSKVQVARSFNDRGNYSASNTIKSGGYTVTDIRAIAYRKGSERRSPIVWARAGSWTLIKGGQS